MKLFTAFRAVGLAGLIVALAGYSRLAAQDVTVTDFQWFNPPDSADKTPVFAKRPSVKYPENMKKDQPGYMLVPHYVDETGKYVRYAAWSSHPYFDQQYNWEKGMELQPATKQGQPIDAVVWYAILFNPKSASSKGVSAQPRLLAVAPVVVANQEVEGFPGARGNRVTVWANVKLDAAGAPQGFTLADSTHERFRTAIEKALPSWSFAPARENGEAVAAELLVPFAVMRAPSKPKKKEYDVPPKVISQTAPIYPMALKRSNQTGQVIVQFIVDEKGKVGEASVKSSNHPAFEEPALAALYKWKFQPATRAGKPVKARMQVPVNFNLGNRSGAEEGAMQVEAASKKDHARLPEELQYDVPARPKGVLYPAYPYALLIKEVAGSAEVRFLVEESGHVMEVAVTKADKPEFGEALAAAVAAFEFVPASKDGRPVKTVLKMEHHFDPSGREARPSAKDLRIASIVRKHPEKIVSAKEMSAVPKPISRRSPSFPFTTVAAKGSATIEFLIDEEGYATLPCIVEATEPAFGYAAAQAAGEWRFEKPLVNGKPAIVRVSVPFNFTRESPEQTPAPPQAKAGIAPSAHGASAGL